MKIFFYFTLLLTLFFSGCIRGKLPTVEQRNQPTITQPTFPSPTSTLTPTPKPILPTLTPTIIPTATEAFLVQQCIQLNVNLTKETVPNDILVVRDWGSGLSLINFASQNNRDINASILSAGTSQDGKWLAYETSSNNTIQIVVESSDGEKSFRIPKAKNWMVMNHILWLDNQRIWFPEINTNQFLTSTLVLNPFTGEKALLKTDYPGIMNFYNYGVPGPLHFGYSSAVYDPSLNFVVYPEFDRGKGYFQTIWDRKSNKVIARVPSSDFYQNLPIWHGSHKQFLIVGFPDVATRKNEWLSVSLDGQIHQITNFGKMGRKYTIENDAELSPDGKTIAFSLSLLKEDGYTTESTHLILLNLETGKSMDTCITADRITWSLDGQYLAVSTAYRLHSNSDVLLIDLKANQAYILLEDSKKFPVGWLQP